MSFRGSIISAFFLIFLCATGAISKTASGQAPAAPGQAASPKLAFEVASVKPSPPLDPVKIRADMEAGKMPRLGAHVSADRAEYIQLTLKGLIAEAYKVKAYQISGPEWLGSERFDVEATMPQGASKNDAPAMLQALLEDRFKLVAHRETADQKVLALVVGKNGTKLKESTANPQPIDPNAPLKPGQMMMDGPNGPMRMTRNPDGSVTFDMGVKGTITQKLDAQNQAIRMESSMVTMAGFADTLSAILAPMGGRQVVDMTGLKGNYEVAVEISLSDLMALARSEGFGPPPPPPGGGASANSGPAATASEPGGGTSIYQSVEQMGLKLEERKAPVEELVIDHVEKMPTEN